MIGCWRWLRWSEAVPPAGFEPVTPALGESPGRQSRAAQVPLNWPDSAISGYVGPRRAADSPAKAPTTQTVGRSGWLPVGWSTDAAIRDIRAKLGRSTHMPGRDRSVDQRNLLQCCGDGISTTPTARPQQTRGFAHRDGGNRGRGRECRKTNRASNSGRRDRSNPRVQGRSRARSGLRKVITPARQPRPWQGRRGPSSGYLLPGCIERRRAARMTKNATLSARGCGCLCARGAPSSL